MHGTWNRGDEFDWRTVIKENYWISKIPQRLVGPTTVGKSWTGFGHVKILQMVKNPNKTMKEKENKHNMNRQFPMVLIF